MRVGIFTGSRNGGDVAAIRKALSQCDFVIHGCARGVDWQVRQEARCMGKDRVTVGAWWRQLGTFAGPDRNLEMVNLGLVFRRLGHDVRGFAFPAPDSKGTWDCVRCMRALHIDVEVL